jgi:hypothetical protein
VGLTVDTLAGDKIFLLNRNNEADVHSYERAFYRSFGHMANVDHIWNIDHIARTIRTKVPYDTQDVYIVKLGDRVVAGAALNFGRDTPLQLEMEGFLINKSANDYCEILQMFCQLDLMNGTPLLQTLAEFFTQKLMEKKIFRLYGTCSQKLVARYQRIGLNVIGDLVYRDEKVYLLEIDLKTPNVFPRAL